MKNSIVSPLVVWLRIVGSLCGELFNGISAQRAKGICGALKEE